MSEKRIGVISKSGRCSMVFWMVAVAAISLVASFFCASSPTAAWADDGLAPQGDTSESMPGVDYYAVLHEDGDLVFQAQPGDEKGAISFAGSCAAYTSGKAPWLAKSDLIESVHFDGSFANIQPASLAYWFIGCKNLKTIDLQNLDASASTSMRSMFQGCSSLKTIEHLSSFNTSSSTYFGSMFRDCSSLTSLDVSHFDATHVGVLCFMFAGCSSLESLNMAGEGWRTSSLYLMVHVWEGCSSLKSLDLSYLDTSGVHSMAKDFNGCSSLEYLDLSGPDTTNVGTLTGMFNGCGKLSTVKLGSKFSFNGLASAPQCSLPDGMWKSSATGAVYASADVPNCMADTYTRVSAGDGDSSPTDPTPGPSDTSGGEPGEYDLPNLRSSLGMFNHFVDGSQKLTITEDKVVLSFITDGSIEMVRNIAKVAIGPSSKLANASDMKEGEAKFTNSLIGNPVIFEGVLVSPAGSDEQYAYELEFDKAEFQQMLADDGGIYLTLFHRGKNAWHKGASDLLLILGDNDAFDHDGETLGTDKPDTPAPSDPEEGGELVDPSQIEDGTYSVTLTVTPSMIKLAGHNGYAPEPKVVVSGEDAWLIASYRSTGNSAWRYGQIAWGSFEEVVAAGKDGFGGAPTFKAGKSAVDGMDDQTIDFMTFALPLKKSDLVEWIVTGEAKEFTMRYVAGYSAEHNGDWWMPTSQSTMTLANLRVAPAPAKLPANYVAILDALAGVPADLSSYSDSSVKRLNEVLASVAGSPKPASDQSEVDALAKAIVDAVRSLEPNAAAEKPASEPKAEPGNSAPKSGADAKRAVNITVNTKTVNAKAIAAAIAAAGGKAKYVQTITLGKKVRSIARGAFKSTGATTVIVKTSKLTKSSVKGALKGSKVKTVKIKSDMKHAKKLFSKKNVGKTVKVLL